MGRSYPWLRHFITPILKGFTIWRVSTVMQITTQIHQLFLVSLQKYPENSIQFCS